MKKYRCIESFSVDSYDADGFLIENSAQIIEKGELYIMDEHSSAIIGGEVHLDHICNRSWLEITREHLHEFFEEVD